MEIIIDGTDRRTTIDQVAGRDKNFVVAEGLLTGQSFNSQDVENIRNGEFVDCYAWKIFDETFDATFE